MSERDTERWGSPLDDETPGSQGDVDPGSEGDFGGPPADPDDSRHGSGEERREPGPTAEEMPPG
jgi:hypothetical protein